MKLLHAIIEVAEEGAEEVESLVHKAMTELGLTGTTAIMAQSETKLFFPKAADVGTEGNAGEGANEATLRADVTGQAQTETKATDVPPAQSGSSAQMQASGLSADEEKAQGLA